MAGPIHAKVSHRDMARILVRQGEGLSRLAQACAKDFETYGQQQAQLQALVADVLVQVEALKVQVTGILALVGGDGRRDPHDA